VQNSLCVQVLRSPILAALLHGTGAVGLIQTLRRGTRTKNGITELSLLAICNLYSEGGHHVQHIAHILVYFILEVFYYLVNFSHAH